MAHSVIEALSGLFVNLELSEVASVAPELELAYLALVTSKDEEAESPVVLPSALDVSLDTNTTLVEDDSIPMTNPPEELMTAPLPPRRMSSTSSVLGKRSSEDREDTDAMNTDRQISPSASLPMPTLPLPSLDDAMLNSPSDVSTEVSSRSSSPVQLKKALPDDVARKTPRRESTALSRADREMTIEPEANVPSCSIEDPNAPPNDPVSSNTDALPPPPALPPRKPVIKDVGNGAMMFGTSLFGTCLLHFWPRLYLLTLLGKQHDVSECLDNCLFQIEAAMDPDKLRQGQGLGSNIIKQSVR